MAKPVRRRPAAKPQKKQRKGKKLPFWKSVVRNAKAYVFYAARGLGIIVIGTLFLVLTTGFRPSIPSFLKGNDSKDKSDSQSASSTATCSAPQTQNKEFSKCAAFWVDYSQPGKSVGEYFNMYVGKPEGNGEAQYYTDNAKNIHIESDNLTLTALNESHQGYRYTSARLDTRGKKSGEFTYGKVVVRAILPNTVGSWPAMWLLPSDRKHAQDSDSEYVKRVGNGEIDFAETMGKDPHVIYGVAHSLAYRNIGADRTFFNTVTVPDSDTAYHDYGVEWTPDQITMSVDDKPFFTYDKPKDSDYTSWPFDQRFYLVINLAIGGSAASENRRLYPGDGIDKKSFPVNMKIQSVSYYPYTGPR